MNRFPRSYKELLIFPRHSQENGYIERMVSLLEGVGVVKPIPSFFSRDLLARLLFSKKADFALLNWLENDLLDADGQFSILRAIKLLLKVSVIKLMARKLIYVKHNMYPHRTRKEDVKKVVFFLSFFSRFFHKIIAHSPHLEKEGVQYVPHPLYVLGKGGGCELNIPFSPKNYFVVFGRLEVYKNVHSLIEILPDEINLLVVGKASDSSYLELLKRKSKGNVFFVSDFVSDEYAEKAICNSNGVVICHREENVIVSGTFFYAASLGVRVFALATPFFRYIESISESSHVVVGNDISALLEELKHSPDQGNESGRRTFWLSYFGDEKVMLSLRKLLEN